MTSLTLQQAFLVLQGLTHMKEPDAVMQEVFRVDVPVLQDALKGSAQKEWPMELNLMLIPKTETLSGQEEVRLEPIIEK